MPITQFPLTPRAALVPLVALALATTLGRAQDAPRLAGPSLSLELASFDSAWSRVKQTYYDTTMRGIDWDGVRRELRPKVEQANSRAETRRAITDMLGRLGESHFAVLPGEAIPESAAPAAGSGHGDVGLTVRLLGGALVVTRVAPGSPGAQGGIGMGWTVEQIDTLTVAARLAALERVSGARERRIAAVRLAMMLGGQLNGAPGSPVRLVMRDGDGATQERTLVRRESAGQVVQMGALPPMHTLLEHERVAAASGCVGVIRFNVFLVPIAPAFDDAMGALGDCRGIILDLRGNIGGVAAMVMGLAGYFFDTEVTLGVLKMRGSELRYVTNPRRVSRSGVPRAPFTGPLAIIVDEQSASTTEIFAAGLQHLGRARVFGDTSAGQALPAMLTRLPNGDALMYAVADYTAPDGRRLEGQGVVPDERAPASRPALLAGRDEAVRAAVRWIERSVPRSTEPR